MTINMSGTPLPIGSASPKIRDDSNPLVTARSRFDDRIWDFADEITNQALASYFKRIDWGWALPNGDSFLMPKYASMLLALKEASRLLLRGIKSYRLRQTKLVGMSYHWRVFVCFLVMRPVPVYRFRDVLPSDIEAFFQGVKSRPGKGGKGTLSTATMVNYYSATNYLYDLREHLSDSLTVRPSGQKSAMAAANHTQARSIKTRYIPDEDAKRLLTVAIKYVEEYAPILFDCWRRVSELKDSPQFKALSLTRRYAHVSQLLAGYRPPGTFSNNAPFERGFEGIHAFEAELLRLRTACFLLIGFSTGMRISEIASVEKGCISTSESRNHGTLYWLTGISYKTEKTSAGVVRKWMCGRLAAKAVTVLEEMSTLLGAGNDTEKLFFTLEQIVGARGLNSKKFKPVTNGPLQDYLREFALYCGVTIHVHPHMFRRTFARNIVRVDGTALLALKEHFKHWSLYMTEWYVGLDPDLISEYEAERQILSIEIMEKICVSPVSGPGGRRWTIELQRRIDEGRLPRNFRGKAGSEFRLALINDLHEVGSLAVPCGDFTYCVFNKDKALCTNGDRPAVNNCNPLMCNSSFIAPEHVPTHRRLLAEDEAAYDKLSDNEKSSPLGETLLRKIEQRRKMLEPFAGTMVDARR